MSGLPLDVARDICDRLSIRNLLSARVASRIFWAHTAPEIEKIWADVAIARQFLRDRRPRHGLRWAVRQGSVEFAEVFLRVGAGVGAGIREAVKIQSCDW